MRTVRPEYYLAGINLAGFCLEAADAWLYGRSGRRINGILMAAGLLGGAPGILGGILILDRRADKSNMMARVFLLCVLALEILGLVFFRGGHRDALSFAFPEFFAAHRVFSAYLLAVNAVTFAAFGIDKWKAVRNRKRIRIVTLLALAFLGGAVGGLAAMYLFRHKVRKSYFAVGLPMILAVQVLAVFCVMNI